MEKIEPTATVQSSVTMFPVLATLDNLEGLLKPDRGTVFVDGRNVAELDEHGLVTGSKDLNDRVAHAHEAVGARDAVAAGMFCGLIPGPLQMLGAAICAGSARSALGRALVLGEMLLSRMKVSPP